MKTRDVANVSLDVHGDFLWSLGSFPLALSRVALPRVLGQAPAPDHIRVWTRRRVRVSPISLPVVHPSGLGAAIILAGEGQYLRQPATLTRQSLLYVRRPYLRRRHTTPTGDFCSGAHSILSPKLWLPVRQGSDDLYSHAVCHGALVHRPGTHHQPSFGSEEVESPIYLNPANSDRTFCGHWCSELKPIPPLGRQIYVRASLPLALYRYIPVPTTSFCEEK